MLNILFDDNIFITIYPRLCFKTTNPRLHYPSYDLYMLACHIIEQFPHFQYIISRSPIGITRKFTMTCIHHLQNEFRSYSITGCALISTTVYNNLIPIEDDSESARCIDISNHIWFNKRDSRFNKRKKLVQWPFNSIRIISLRFLKSCDSAQVHLARVSNTKCSRIKA